MYEKMMLVVEIKNSIDGFGNRRNIATKHINELKDYIRDGIRDG